MRRNIWEFHTYLDDTLEVDIHAIWELESLKKDENYIRKLSLYSSTIFHLEVGVGQHVSSRVKVLHFLERAHDLFSNLKQLVFFKIW